MYGEFGYDDPMSGTAPHSFWPTEARARAHVRKRPACVRASAFRHRRGRVRACGSSSSGSARVGAEAVSRASRVARDHDQPAGPATAREQAGVAQRALHAQRRRRRPPRPPRARRPRRSSIAGRSRESAGEVSASAPTPAAISAGTRAATAVVVERPLLEVDRRGAALAAQRLPERARPRTLPAVTTAATAPPPQAAPACGIGASRPISATAPRRLDGERVEHAPAARRAR